MADAGAGAGAVALSSNAVLTTADIKHLSVAQCDRLLHRIRAGMESLSNTDELELNLTRAQRVLNAFGETENPEEFAAAATCVSTASRLIRRAKGSFLIQNTTSSLASLTDVGTQYEHERLTLTRLVRKPAVALTLDALWDSEDPQSFHIPAYGPFPAIIGANVNDFDLWTCGNFIRTPSLGAFWRASIYLRSAKLKEIAASSPMLAFSSDSRQNDANRAAVCRLDSCRFWISELERDVNNSDLVVMPHQQGRIAHLKQRAETLRKELLPRYSQIIAASTPSWYFATPKGTTISAIQTPRALVNAASPTTQASENSRKVSAASGGTAEPKRRASEPPRAIEAGFRADPANLSTTSTGLIPTVKLPPIRKDLPSERPFGSFEQAAQEKGGPNNTTPTGSCAQSFSFGSQGAIGSSTFVSAFDYGSSDSIVKPPTPFGAQTFSFGTREASERTPTRFSTPANISSSIPTGTGPFGASTSSTPFTTAAKRLREPSDKSHDGGASSRKGEVSAVAPRGYQRPTTAAKKRLADVLGGAESDKQDDAAKRQKMG